MDMLMDWNKQPIDCILAFTQAPNKADIYMRPPKVPRWFQITGFQHPPDALTRLDMMLKNCMV